MDHWTEGQTRLPKPMRYISVIMCMGVNILEAISVTLLTVLERCFQTEQARLASALPLHC